MKSGGVDAVVSALNQRLPRQNPSVKTLPDYCRFKRSQYASTDPILHSSFPPAFVMMSEKQKSRQPSPTRAVSRRPSPKDTPETTRPNSLREKSDDEKSSSSPEDLEDRELQTPPTHPPTVPDSEGRRELKEWECWDKLAYSWPKWKKAMYLSSIAGIQISMNFNTSVYPSAVNPLVEHFGISDQQARVGQMIYLVMYSFGCELWAPWSEEFGRWPILQLSLFFINIWQIPNSVAPNYATIVVCRALVSRTFDRIVIITNSS